MGSEIVQGVISLGGKKILKREQINMWKAFLYKIHYIYSNEQNWTQSIEVTSQFSLLELFKNGRKNNHVERIFFVDKSRD